LPGIVERFDAGVRASTGRRAKQHVVAGVRIERRIEIDQVHARIGDVLAQNFEIVAVVERVRHSTPKRAKPLIPGSFSRYVQSSVTHRTSLDAIRRD
jgi:hypothetical protein